MSCTACPAGMECPSVDSLPKSCDPGYYSLEGGRVKQTMCVCVCVCVCVCLCMF